MMVQVTVEQVVVNVPEIGLHRTKALNRVKPRLGFGDQARDLVNLKSYRSQPADSFPFLHDVVRFQPAADVNSRSRMASSCPSVAGPTWKSTISPFDPMMNVSGTP